MRSFKVIGSAIAAALILASSASATSWDPQNTVVHGHGNLTLTSGSGVVSCTVTLNTKASGAVATTTDAAGNPAGPTFSSCTNNLGLSPTVVTSTGDWTATATSTTTVDVRGAADINIGNGACQINATATVPNNGWSNATHTITASSATSFPITKAGFCPLTTSTATMSGSVAFPASVVIT